MRVWIALSAVSVLAAALPANAQTYSLGPIDSGPVDVTPSYKPGYTLIDFNNGTSPFVGGGVKSGTVTDQYVAPAGDTTPYFSVGPSTTISATLALSGINQLSFYWGSLDTYNVITFEGLGRSFSGSVFGGTDSTVYRPSREVTFYFSPSESAALTGITLTSRTNAFELDNLIFGSAAPEPGTWAMMIAGFSMVGFALRRRQKVAARVSYAV
ncbi:PEPxxWA-CTERM sorting domain-containing protein [uncultured Sphingomonas sp.]|uniref:PEPxxWA-CTERM sorting domain-containing protein n=1 Tax=uncultured Sphingomonas sp. TaxID=158754 RepID=UPI0035CB39E7